MILAGGSGPLFSKQCYLTLSFPCPKEMKCEIQYFDGFMALSLVKHSYLLAFSSCFYYLIEIQLLYNRGKRPYFSRVEDIQSSRNMSYKRVMPFILTAFIDCMKTICLRWALIYTQASTIAMFGTFQILVAALMDMILKRRALILGKIFAIFIVITGLTVSAYGAFLTTSDENVHRSHVMAGILLSLIGASFRGLHSSVQGSLMKKDSIPPIKAIFIENVFAVPIMIIMYIIVNGLFLHGVKRDIWMIYNNPKLVWLMTIFGCNTFLFYSGSTIVGKFVSGLFRMMITSINVCFLWILEMCFGWTKFSPLTLIGWVTVTCGIVLYGGVNYRLALIMPWYFRPLTCRGLLRPPTGSILTQKQKLRSKGVPETAPGLSYSREIEIY